MRGKKVLQVMDAEQATRAGKVAAAVIVLIWILTAALIVLLVIRAVRNP
jgi:hypothetical protein